MATVGNYSWQNVLTNANGTSKWRVGYCDNFVANMWGQSMSGYATAVDNWNATPVKVTGSDATKDPAPAGALYYWGGGAGHVALSAGDGTVYSTDIGGAGTVTRVPLSEINTKWNKPFLGWAPPYFNGRYPGKVGPDAASSSGKSSIYKIIGDLGTGNIGGFLGDVASGAENAVGGLISFPSEIINFFKEGTSDLASFLGVFSAFFKPATYIRIAIGVFGLIALIAGAFFIVREASNGS